MGSDVVNVEQAEAWNGDEGVHWASHADRYDAAIRRHHERLFEAAAIAPADRVLDIGCGCGASTREAARRATSGSALGVDLSAQMLDRARELAREEGLTSVAFEQADAQVHRFEEHAFDLAISRFGVMFFQDPVAAFGNIGRALRPDGRVAMLSWRALAENEWLLAIRGALAAGRPLPEPPMGAPGPFGLADPTAVRRILDEAGFDRVELEEVDEPICFGADPDDAFSFLRGNNVVRGLLQDLDDRTSERALDELRASLAAHATDEGVLFATSAWLITARRRP